VHHTGFIVAEARQIYRGYTNSDHGIDGEIEFKDDQGRASGKRLVAGRHCCRALLGVPNLGSASFAEVSFYKSDQFHPSGFK
jgi:hypothetical protein